MRLNPIYKKDELVANRSYLLPLLILALNGVYAILVLINLYSITNRAAETGEIQYADFLRLYQLLAIAELVLILLLSPALTSSSITSERERRTLGILLSTQLTAMDIVLGKLMGALNTVLVLVASTLPVLTTVFIFGGVSRRQVLLLLLSYVLSSVYAAAIGITASTFQHSTAVATAIAYVAVFISFGIFLFFWYFRARWGLQSIPLLLVSLGILLLLSIVMLYMSERRLMPRRSQRAQNAEAGGQREEKASTA